MLKMLIAYMYSDKGHIVENEKTQRINDEQKINTMN